MKHFGKEWESLKIVLPSALAVLTALPAILAGVVGHQAGMLVSILLLLVVNPCFFAFLGMHGAKKGSDIGVKAIVFSVAAFALGAVAGLGMELGFVARYAAAYAVLGFSTMGIVRSAKRKKKSRR